MSAAVEVSGFNAAFASRGEPAWHLLGTVFPEDQNMTTSDMLDLAHMSGWDVRFADVNVTGVADNRHATPQRGVVRTNPFDGENDLLAVVGERYHLYQNEDVLAFADNLTDGGLVWETAGSIKDGRVIFGSLRAPKTITLDPKGRKDEIRDYLLVTSSHDGSIPLTAMNTPVRVVCQNTLNAALTKKAVKQAFRIRHTQSMAGRVEEARKILAINSAYFSEFVKVAEELITTEITKAQFDKIIDLTFPAPDKDAKAAAKTRYAKKIDLAQDIYVGQADGPDTMGTITGTAWGAYNALTEMSDWYRKPRKDDAESVVSAASGFDSVTTAKKNKILEIVSTVALP